MRHRLKPKKLGSNSKHRKALLRNLATSFFKSEQLRTTLTKAKQLRPFAERLITRARVDNLHNRRLVYRHVKNKTILKKLFENLALRYQNRPGGYTRIYKLQSRKGDASPMALIQLVPEQLASDLAREGDPTKESKGNAEASPKGKKDKSN